MTCSLARQRGLHFLFFMADNHRQDAEKAYRKQETMTKER